MHGRGNRHRVGLPRRGIPALGLLALLATAMVATSAQAASANAAQRHAAAGRQPVVGAAAALLDGLTSVAKTKTTVSLPAMLFRVDANYETDYLPPDNPIYIDSYSHAWVRSPAGAPKLYGYFPAVPTAVLAFGSIPVTATMQLIQVSDRTGQLVPFTIYGHGLFNSPYTVFPTRVSGDVQLRLTNVMVDKLPLEVGSHCQLRTPMHLAVYGDAASYNLFLGGSLYGTATIPPFAGCGANGQDLDPLLTGMISGPNNAVHMRQGTLGGWIDPDGPCNACQPPHDGLGP